VPKDSRSSASAREDELRLPRPPGVVRRFWARHPLLTDILIMTVCLLGSLGPVTAVIAYTPGGHAASWILVPAAVIGSGLLLRRRQWPVAVFIVSVCAAAAFLLAAAPVGGPLPLVTAYSLAVYRSSRACWIGLGAAVGALAALSLTLSATGVVNAQIAANAVVGEAVLGLIGALIGVNVGNRKRYLDAVISRSRQLLVERDQHAQLAAAAERARIAREMHDVVSHSLTVIVALSEGAGATHDAERARTVSAQVADTARTALREMRGMLGVLRDDEAAAAPLAPMDDSGVTTAVTAAQRAGFPVTLTVSGHVDVSRPVRLALTRIAQEGLTNAMRHAPAATEISVSVAYGVDDVEIVVDNDGVLGTAHGGGYGLRGLRERVAHVGGTIESGPVDAGRWRVHARMPHSTEGDL